MNYFIFVLLDCRVDFSQAGGADHDGRGGIRLHHGSCNMDRQRIVGIILGKYKN
jgi:hypothetical protein